MNKKNREFFNLIKQLEQENKVLKDQVEAIRVPSPEEMDSFRTLSNHEDEKLQTKEAKIELKAKKEKKIVKAKLIKKQVAESKEKPASDG